MADDIVQRLVPYFHDEQRMPAGMIRDVMAEIERLRQLSDELYRALQMVRRDRPSAHTDEVWNAVAVAIDAWEASRG